MRSLVPLATVIVSGIVYHLAQKTSGAGRPWPTLAVAYGVAFVLTLVLAVAAGDVARWQPSRGEAVGGLLLGLAALGIEASFFFLYRAGWPLASVSVIANASVTAVLAAVGIVVFREHITAARGAGLALAAAGSVLIARG